MVFLNMSNIFFILYKILKKSIDKLFYLIYISILLTGCSAGVARMSWEHDVAGSNPVTPIFRRISLIKACSPFFI